MIGRLAVGWLALTILAVGCGAPAARAPSGSETGQTPAAAAPKRITVGISRDIPVLRAQLARVAASGLPGVREIEMLVNAGLAIGDQHGEVHPELAEAVPTLDNGLWQLFPDGSMQLTWHIAPGAAWQDGTPFTADDLVFTATVGQDPELPQFRNPAYNSLESVEAPDPATVVATWRAPYIAADHLFSVLEDLSPLPLPKHLLETAYEQNKAGFADLPYWSTDFVGTGPYRVAEWERGSHMVLAANDQYVRGRPKIDEIDVRIIVDTNAFLVNVIAGVVEIPLTGRFSLQEIVQVRDQWQDGQTHIVPSNSLNLFPNLKNPTPSVLLDVRFRRALLQALDRAEMADTLAQGLSSVANSTIVPGTPEYDTLKSFEVRYDYDPRQAAAAIQALGYTRGQDGAFRDADGQRLTLDVRSDGIDTLQSGATSAIDYWQRLGIDATLTIIPIQRQGDGEYRATFTGFDTARSSGGLRGFTSFVSSQVRTPENHYSGANFPSYANPEYDALVARYQATIPPADRMQVAGQIVHHMTENLIYLPTYYSVSSTMIAKRIKNVPADVGTDYSITWNAADWDVAAP